MSKWELKTGKDAPEVQNMGVSGVPGAHLVQPSPGMALAWHGPRLAWPSPGMALTWHGACLAWPSPGMALTWYGPHLVWHSPGMALTWYGSLVLRRPEWGVKPRSNFQICGLASGSLASLFKNWA